LAGNVSQHCFYDNSSIIGKQVADNVVNVQRKDSLPAAEYLTEAYETEALTQDIFRQTAGSGNPKENRRAIKCSDGRIPFERKLI
jgi:hypothetical protein